MNLKMINSLDDVAELLLSRHQCERNPEFEPARKLIEQWLRSRQERPNVLEAIKKMVGCINVYDFHRGEMSELFENECPGFRPCDFEIEPIAQERDEAYAKAIDAIRTAELEWELSQRDTESTEVVNG